jgi:malto-oligosyltrehalose trehalohydrolase
MKRRHNMPFGAECRNGGGVRFRLWAPAAGRVDLCLDNASDPIPLEPLAEGWFELVTDLARSGTQYRFRIDDKQEVPDPAARFQPKDVHGPSEVVDPEAFDWQDQSWHGRRWEEAVIYELHVGAFTTRGSFTDVRQRLDHLVDLGITAIELMPVADFPGKCNWGYDGVLPFAPDSTYGRPEDLKGLVQSAHARGIMVLLDVVYNHFGPEGNYLGAYAPQFFTDRHSTPWGKAINFDGTDSRTVRDFFIHNALYWLAEYHFDGLRLDAVHAIADDSTPDILTELAAAVRNCIDPHRKIHLILENERNQSLYLRRTPPGNTREHCQPALYTAQWNDDLHHALHVLITGERYAYYSDYSERPLHQLGRCLVEGFAYQGEASLYRNGAVRGESTAGLPPSAFVSFLQNHDQVGNRAYGERLTTIADPRAIRAAAAILLLAPSPPMLFMGEEFGTETPFLFFCDFEKDLAAAVTAGRRNEFASFAAFGNPMERERIPDPNMVTTFRASQLGWTMTDQTRQQDWLRFYRQLLQLRRKYLVPRLSLACRPKAQYQAHEDGGLSVRWDFNDRSALTLLANLGRISLSTLTVPAAQVIYASDEINVDALQLGTLPARSVLWCLQS